MSDVHDGEIERIYKDGRHYDRMFPGHEEVIRFWISRAGKHGDPILELACGTGRLTIPLASAGFDVSGLDISGNMLAEAERKSMQGQHNIDFYQADIRNFTIDRKYSLIFIPANSICHLLKIEDFEAAMASVRNHLVPEGIFMVEVFVPDLKILTVGNDISKEFASYDAPDGAGRVIINYTSAYDQAEQIKFNTLSHNMPDQEKVITSTLPMRMYFPKELDALFKYNGFDIINKYGDTHLTMFNQYSSNQIFELKVGR